MNDSFKKKPGPVHKENHTYPKRSITYMTWQSMKQRCLNPAHPRYSYYGGRGLTIHPSWMKFENFLSDMGVKPEGTTIERIDNSQGYSKANCRWATPLEQTQNRLPRTPNPSLLPSKARKAGLPYHTVYQRILHGWSEEKALSTPVLPRPANNWLKYFRPKPQEQAPKGQEHSTVQDHNNGSNTDQKQPEQTVNDPEDHAADLIAPKGTDHVEGMLKVLRG